METHTHTRTRARARSHTYTDTYKHTYTHTHTHTHIHPPHTHTTRLSHFRTVEPGVVVVFLLLFGFFFLGGGGLHHVRPTPPPLSRTLHKYLEGLKEFDDVGRHTDVHQEELGELLASDFPFGQQPSADDENEEKHLLQNFAPLLLAQRYGDAELQQVTQTVRKTVVFLCFFLTEKNSNTNNDNNQQ